MDGNVAATMTRTASRTSQRESLFDHVENGLLYALLLVFAVIFAFPFLWTLSTSLKQPWEIFAFPPSMLPSIPQWINYPTVFELSPFFRWIENTLFVVLLSTTGALFSSAFVAYSFARFRYRGREMFFLLTLGTMMLPAQVTLIPQFILFHDLGWVNTLYPLWVPSVFGGGAFNIFLLRQFMLSVPRELDEAAKIDGASPIRIWWSVILPLCKPALATVAVLSFISGWNDFINPLIYLNSPSRFTLALGLSFFQNVPETAGMPTEHLLMAASVMTILPCVFLFLVAQRYFVEGIVMTGIKG